MLTYLDIPLPSSDFVLARRSLPTLSRSHSFQSLEITGLFSASMNETLRAGKEKHPMFDSLVLINFCFPSLLNWEWMRSVMTSLRACISQMSADTSISQSHIFLEHTHGLNPSEKLRVTEVLEACKNGDEGTCSSVTLGLYYIWKFSDKELLNMSNKVHLPQFTVKHVSSRSLFFYSLLLPFLKIYFDNFRVIYIQIYVFQTLILLTITQLQTVPHIYSHNLFSSSRIVIYVLITLPSPSHMLPLSFQILV